MPRDTTDATTATIYRKAIGPQICPHGLKARDLLRRKGYAVDDHLLTSDAEVEAFKTRHGVKTTPQIWLGDTHIGGNSDLRTHLGVDADPGNLARYSPIIALFSVAALMALATTWLALQTPLAWQTLGWFIAISMVLLGLQKLKDIDSFVTMFLGYDLLARRYVPYARVYPFAETGAGLLMLAGVGHWLSVPVALFIAGIGAVSVLKAVYIDRRDLKCACVGGSTDVPLGFVSLTENLMMIGMALWMGWVHLL